MATTARLRENVTIRYARPLEHPGHRALLRAKRKKNYFAAGRGWRKSSFLVNRCLDHMEQGVPCWWGAFTGKPIERVIEELWKSKIFGPEQWERYYNATKMILQLPGWGPLQFVSLEEPDNARGASPGFMVLDEAGLLPRGVFASVVSKIRAKLDCELWAPGTPDPTDPQNDFYDLLHLDTSKHENADVMNAIIPAFGARVMADGETLVRDPHPFELPHYGKATEEEGWTLLWREWMQTSPRDRILFRIEVLCEFLRASGNQIENPEKVCVLPYVNGAVEGEYILKDYPVGTSAGGWFQSGNDFALSSNFNVFSVLDRSLNKQVYMRRFIPTQNTEEGRFGQIYDGLLRMHRMFPGMHYGDANGIGASVSEAMLKKGVYIEGLKWAGTTNVKEQMMNHLSDLIEGNKILLLNHPQIRLELGRLQRVYTANGVKVRAPGKETDDIPSSLMMMCKDVEGGITDEPIFAEDPYEAAVGTFDINPFSTINTGYGYDIW